MLSYAGRIDTRTGVMVGHLDLDTMTITDLAHHDTLGGNAGLFSFSGKPFGGLPDCNARSAGKMLAFSPGYADNGIVFGVSYMSVVVSYDRGNTWNELASLSTTEPWYTTLIPYGAVFDVSSHIAVLKCVKLNTLPASSHTFNEC